MKLVVRVVALLALLGGLVLGGLGVASHRSAADDQDEVDALKAEHADLEDEADTSATARIRLDRQVARRLQRVYQLESRVHQVSDPASDLSADDRRVLEAFNRAINAHNASDTAGAQTIAVEILLPLLDEERADLRAELAAQSAVRAARRALQETEG